MTISTRKGVAVAIAVTATLAAMPVAMPAQGERLQATALAVNMSNIGGGGAITVEITIDRWSATEERTALISTMLEKGPEALLRELTKLKPCGRFAIPSWKGPDPHQLRLGYNLQFARQVARPDGGRQIVLLTDRYIGFEELQAMPRTLDYPFTLIELRVDKNGNGEGKMAIATMITFDKKRNEIELENYSSEPVRLQSVKLRPVK